KSGAVHGKVKVEELASDGEIAGELDAGSVRLAGVVRDGTILRAKSLSVKLASDRGMQVMFGECALEVGEAPTREASVEKPKTVPPPKPEKGESVAPPPLGGAE